MDIEWETFLGIDWNEVKTTEELLEARFPQLAFQEKRREVAFHNMISTCTESMHHWDKSKAHCLWGPLPAGTLVLIFTKSLEYQVGNLFAH